MQEEILSSLRPLLSCKQRFLTLSGIVGGVSGSNWKEVFCSMSSSALKLTAAWMSLYVVTFLPFLGLLDNFT